MRDAAHGESLDHEVYRRPFVVEPAFEDWQTPGNYHRRHIGPDKLPPKMKVWLIQSRRRDSGGVASRSYGFEDSPDAEAIALGFNSGKEYGAVGIGRHANILQWGYIGSPSEMTEAGRRLFLNCICYIHRFDNRAPLIHRQKSHRLQAIRLALLIDRIRDERFFAGAFSPELMDKYRSDPNGLADFFRRDLEFVYHDGTFRIDTEAKALGLASNRTEAALRRLIELRDDPQSGQTARRLLARYTTESFDTTEHWRDWLRANRERIFFSDVGGYKFFVRPEGYPVGHRNQSRIGRQLFR